MTNQSIYLDYAATTPVDPRVVQRMMEFLAPDGCFANPASNHAAGRQARHCVEQARAQVAGLVGATPQDIIWTSGATESDNLALKGAARFFANRGRHIVTVKTEHKAVLDACGQLEREGFEVTYLVPDSDGIVSVPAVAEALRKDTVLVAVMHVNNETGVIQDIAAIGELCRQHEVLFHVDAAQSAGKIPIDLSRLAVDLMAFSAHKAYGPKGIGALFVRKAAGLQLEPLIHGGGQERGMRSGTLATHQIVGMGEAFDLASRELEDEMTRLRRLRDKLWTALATLPGAKLNGHAERRVPGILNVSFAGMNGESLLLELCNIAVSSGAACNAADRQGSYVLRALGRSDREAQASLRFSVGRFTTPAEIDQVVAQVSAAVERLSTLAPEPG